MGKTKPASNRAVRRRWVEQHFMVALYGILAGAALIYMPAQSSIPNRFF